MGKGHFWSEDGRGGLLGVASWVGSESSNYFLDRFIEENWQNQIAFQMKIWRPVVAKLKYHVCGCEEPESENMTIRSTLEKLSGTMVNRGPFCLGWREMLTSKL